MDNMLCDELLQEIFKRLPSKPSSSLSVSLVSKRWLNLYRSSKSSLCLRFFPHNSLFASLSSLLSYYPSLSSLSLHVQSDSITKTNSSTVFNDHLLFIVSCYCSNIKHLRALAGPVSVPCLFSISKSCAKITCITVSLSKPLLLNWVVSFTCLKELYLYICSTEGVDDEVNRFVSFPNEELNAEFGLETLFLSGIQADDNGVGWLWKNCKRLKRLQLKNCGSVGDVESFSSFLSCVIGLEEVELRKCRSIVDGVLLKLAKNCVSLNSLLVYDGGSKEGLLEFMNTCRCNLQKLDLRLPLDLNNNHLSAVAMNLRHLETLRLQSCCLVTGEGLNTLGTALHLEELALINCDIIEREIGLLATLGQNLRMLRKLDLSYNELLVDKELISMLVSCNNLTDLKLRGCRKITGVALVSISKNNKCLQSVDIMNCPGIEAEAVELFVLNCSQMRQLVVEDSKVSDTARTRALHKFIEERNSRCRGQLPLNGKIWCSQ